MQTNCHVCKQKHRNRTWYIARFQGKFDNNWGVFERLMKSLDSFKIFKTGAAVSKQVSIDWSLVGTANKFIMKSFGGDWFMKN